MTATAPGLVVVTYNSRQAISKYGQSHVSLAAALGVPLVVWDNASQDGSAEAYTALGGGLTNVVRSPRNTGYAAGVNGGAARIPERDIFLLNPDVEAPSAEDLSLLGGTLESEPRAAAIGPKLLELDGSQQPSARRFPSLLAMAGSSDRSQRVPAIRRARERYLEPMWSRKPVKVDWVIGAAMLIRREAFDRLGGWDERYFLYMEDVDFCRRSQREGWDVWFDPRVALEHGYERASTLAGASFARSSARRSHVSSLVRFFAKEPRMLFGGGRR